MSDQQPNVRHILQREIQLNTLAYLIIAVLLVLVGVLAYMVLTEVGAPDWWLLDNEIFRALSTGLLLMVVLYMIDQHQRLRAQLVATHDRLEAANDEIRAAYDRLAFAQRAAELMTSLEQEDPVRTVLRESAAHFGAEAVAVVGEDVELYTVDGVEDEAAQPAVLTVALDAVRAGKPLSISNSRNGSEALAVPLRFRGELRSVLCLWRRGEAFCEEQLEGLGLIARIVELSGENRMLLAEVRAQLAGTLRTLAALIDRRVPDYVRSSNRMADLAVGVGTELGLATRRVSDLRVAAMLTDVGMLDIPEHILAARRSLTPEELAEVRSHPGKGAEVARNANFSEAVQEAIHDHHERLDGSGYPRRRRGEQISLEARILAVCDVFNSMTSDRPHRTRLTQDQAVAELVRGVDTLYDRKVVRALLKSLGYRPPERTTRYTTDVTPEALATPTPEVVEVN